MGIQPLHTASSASEEWHQEEADQEKVLLPQVAQLTESEKYRRTQTLRRDGKEWVQ